MKKESFNLVRLGLFVITALIIFTIAIYYIGNRQNMFGSTFGISTLFQNVKGLQPGNNVRYAGIDVGSVDEIIIINDSTLQVNMILEKKVQPHIKRDARATIASDGLVGNMIINISPSTSEEPAVKDGDILPSFTRIATEDLLSTLGNTNDNIALLSAYLLEITREINEGQGSLGMLLRDSLMAYSLQSSTLNMAQTSFHLQKLSKELDAVISKVNRGEGNIGQLLNDTSIAANLENVSTQINTAVEDQLAPILNNLNQTSQDIATASQQLNNILGEVSLEEGLVAKVFKDSIVAEDFQGIMQNLEEGTGRFNENMEALKHNFFFRGYFKKQEKRRKKEERKATKLASDS